MTSIFLRLATLLVGAVVAACGDSNRAPDASCDGSDVCAPGLTCAGGLCRAPCNTGEECPVGKGCAGGLCMPLSTGTCGQAADCKTPPDACHTAVNPTCTLGKCEYERLTTGPCDTRDPLGSTCSDDQTCQSGFCTDGRCCESRCDGGCVGCGADGQCDQLADEGTRCGATEDCGRCDGASPDCHVLVSFDPAVRYFIEEDTSALDRVDFFGLLDLDAAGSSGVTTGQLPTGRYVQWSTTANSYSYCGLLGDGALNEVVQVATVEAVVSIADGNAMMSSTIVVAGPVGPSEDRLELGVKRVVGDAPGRVTFLGTFGRNSAEWTVTISGRTVVHMLVDGRKAAAHDSLNLYVNGDPVSRSATGTPAVPSQVIDLDALDVLCIGNDVETGGAFIGRLHYAAMYLGVFDASEVSDAALRLTSSDAP